MPGTTLVDIENWFTYHAPKGDQAERYAALRSKAKEFAQLILVLTPSCPDQTAALRHLRETVYSANAAIACNE